MIEKASTSRMAQKSKGNVEGEDVSMLRTPIQLHGKAVEQILNSVHYGTPELRSLLLDECDIIFECKVCRALFRDLPNLVSHKRRYCSKSATENNHIAIARIPDEKVYVIQPEAPESSKSKVTRGTRKSKPSLDETISRIKTGELGHSEAFKVYSDAANKLQRQKEEMKVATIRTRAIPTNSNAVFIDVNMASVNIHERSAASTSGPTSSGFNSKRGHSVITRKFGENIVSKDKSPLKRAKKRILRKDCKNSEELQKLLLKELKEIQHKVKQRAHGNNPLKQSAVTWDSAKLKIDHSEDRITPPRKAIKLKDTGSMLEDAGLIKNHRQKPTTPKAKTITNCDTHPVKTSKVISTEKKSKILKVASPDMSKELKSKSPPKANYKLGRKALICQKCHKIFSSKQSLTFHNKVIHSPKKTFFPCLYCPSVFYYFYGVTRHLKMNHSKTKSEINALRKQLRAKAYSKVLPEVDESAVKMRAAGLRKGLRNKQEAFSSETSPGSSYVLHSVKKMGKKLSAKKDALSSEAQNTVLSNESRSANEKGKHGNVGSDSHVKSPAVKKEIERPSNQRLHVNSSHDSFSSVSPVRHRTLEKDSKKSSEALRKPSPAKKSLVHSCKKCHRFFGRNLAYKNHIKVCQGKTPVLSHGGRRGRPRKILSQQDTPSSTAVSRRGQKEALLLRGRKVVRAENTTPLSSVKTSVLSKTTPHSSNQSTRSSSRETIKSERLSQQLESESEADVSHRSRNASLHLRGSKFRSSSVPRSTSISDDITALIKSERRQSRTPERKITRNHESQGKYDEKAVKDPDKVNSVVSEDEKSTSHMDRSKCTASSTTPRTTISDKVPNQSFCHIARNPSQIQEDTTIFIKDSKADNGAVITKVVKEPVPVVSENSTAKLRSTAPVDLCKDKRSSSVERDVRGKISHLVPRGSGVGITPSNMDLCNSKHPVSPITDRPRRKRKVPSRNMDAIDMLSKIHNPEKDDPPSKKRTISQGVGLITSKAPRGRPPVNSKQASGVKSQTQEVKVEGEPTDEEMQDEEEDIKEGRLTKSRSRIFVLGRSKPRGRKLLRSYDNARVDKLIDIQNSKCLVCGEHYSQIFNLRRHVIRIHLQWSRYQCKLCRFASFDRSECTTHIIRNHHRAINIKDTQVVNSCITDLAKQGSQAMTRKKNQTLRDKKSRQQNKESNIYARPNVRKMPRLAERTLIQEKGQSSDSSCSNSPHCKQKSDDTGSIELNSKTLRQSRVAETMMKDVSENSNSLKRPPLPFNISTRNSPRMFDTRPYKTHENSLPDTQGEVAVLYTRKGVYTKAVPSILSKEKSASEVIVASDSSAKQSNDNADVNEKSSVKLEIKNEINPAESKNIFDKMGLVNIPVNNDRENETNEGDIKGIKSGASVLSSEVIQGEVTSKLSLQGCEDNRTNVTDIDNECCVSKVLPSKSVKGSDKSSHLSTSSLSTPCGPEVMNFKEDNKDILGSTITVSDPSVSPQKIRISPSYVVIKSARIPPTSQVGASPSSAVKTLNFVNNIASSLSNSTPNASSINTSHPSEPSQTKMTLLDDIGDDSKQSSDFLSSPSSEQTLLNSRNAQDN